MGARKHRNQANTYQKRHNQAWLHTLDGSAYAISFITPIMTMPQVIEVWRFHHVAGVSILTWTAYALMNALWITYGLARRAPAVTFGNGLMLLFNAAVAVGAVINH